MSSAEAIRAKVVADLKALGYKPSTWLPLSSCDATMRPAVEIASRLHGLTAMYAWVMAPPNEVADEQITQYLDAHQLVASLDEEERVPLDMDRREANAEFSDAMAWKVEVLWMLGWVLGFDPAPGLDGAIFTDEIARALVFGFIQPLEHAPSDFVAQHAVRSAAEVIDLEQRFYFAHNAARTAQLGNPSMVPPGFDPGLNGGVIQTRRHCLTWCLSPGVDWDDVDLST